MSQLRSTTPPVLQSESVTSVISVPGPSRGATTSTSKPKHSKGKRRKSSSSSVTSTSSSSSNSQREEVKGKRRKRRAYLSSVNFLGSGYGEESMIPVFDPQKSDQAIDLWVRRVDELAACYGWNDLTIIKLVASRLVGLARRWYDSQEGLAVNWKKMKKLLMKQFSKPLPFSKLLREAALYEAQSGQDLSEYCFNKLDKLRALKLEIPETYLIDAVIGGITDENIARSARSSRFCTTNELYAYLSTLGTMPRTFKSTSERKVFSGTPQQREITTGGVPKAKLQCFNCKGPHRVRDCPKPKVECYYCKRLGHRQNKCPDKQGMSGKNVSEISVKNKNNDNPYIVNVMLNGKKFKCLIDTGSSCTVIRRSVAELLGLDLTSDCQFALTSFSGDRVQAIGRVKLNVRIAQPSATLSVTVLGDDQMMHDCIIGRDFIDLPHVMLLKIGSEVSVRQLNTCVKQTCDFECFVIQADTGFNFGDISDEQKHKCVELLNEFKDRISTSMADLGKTDAVQMEIRLVTNEPIVYRPYRLPLAEKEILRGIIDELLTNNIIRESRSAYASPILLVRKKTGDYRMCVDYRRLNAITIKDKFPLPLIDEQLDRLGTNKQGEKYKFFTTLDLASGFYQVPVAEDSVDKTAFITPDHHYEFLRMPFGLCNSPSVFQRLINNVLGSLKNDVAFPYMDDVIIPSTTVEEGVHRLRSVLETFRKHNLTLKITKCSFFHTQIDYLGREISAEGVRPGQHKIDAVLQVKAPTTVKEVRQFLGLTGYFRKFVQNYSSIVEPLTRLTRKDSKWCWEEEQQRAFVDLKRRLTMRPVLAIFDPNLSTELHTDASSVAVAAILLQNHDGKQRVVAYFSKQTTVDQKHYHSYELETMAVVLALQHFRTYLLGLQFTVITDCSALRTAFSKKDLLPRIGRWWLQVQEFTFDIKHRPGARMSHVDALSRLPVADFDVNQIDITEEDWILAAQLQDEQLSRIRQILEAGDENAETKQYFKEYVLRKGKVYRKLPDGKQLWVVPRAARWQIVRLCHDRAGHMSVENTLKRIMLNYWFPKMRRFVTKYILACLNCAYYKSCNNKKSGKLHPIEKYPIPFHTLHLDHLGPFETSKSGKKFLLVIVDSFTKFTIIEAVKSTKVKPVIRVLQSIMCIFGVPARIISDRGSAFTSRTFQIFCESYAIKHVLNAVATPRSNGQCERYNRTIINMLATTFVEDDADKWDCHVKEIQSALNTSFNKSINTTPVKALFGYQTKPIAEASLLNTLETSVEKLNIADLRNRIAEHINHDQRKQKEQYDKRRREATRFKENDLVRVLITSEPSTGSSKKLLPKYKGPFRVIKVLFNDRYEVEDLRENKRRRNIRTVAAADKMEKWITMLKE